jgi:hypothetical protein
LRNKSTNNIKFLLKSGLWPLVNLKRIWAKHLAVQTNRKVSDEWLMKNHLLLSMGRAFQLVLEIREDHIQKN